MSSYRSNHRRQQEAQGNGYKPNKTSHDPAHAAVQRNAVSGCRVARKSAAGGSRRHVGPSECRAAPGRLSAILCFRGGCRVRDVDGREYIDFMCSWGPILLGHRHPEVQAAAEAQAVKGDCLTVRARSWWNSPKSRRHVPHADWAMFQKNGADATTCCVTMHAPAPDAARCWCAWQLSRRAAMVLAKCCWGDGRRPRASAAFEYNECRAWGLPSKRRARIRSDPGDGLRMTWAAIRTANEGIRGSRACGSTRPTPP